MAHVDRPPRSPSWWGRVPASPLGSSTGSLAWRLPSSSESLTDSEIRHDAAQSIAGFLLNQAPAAEKMQVEPSCPPKSIRKRTARSCPAHSIGPPTKRCSAPHAPLAGSTEDVPEPGRGPAELASDVRSARLNALFHLYGSNFRASVPAPRLHVASNHPTETAHMEPRQRRREGARRAGSGGRWFTDRSCCRPARISTTEETRASGDWRGEDVLEAYIVVPSGRRVPASQHDGGRSYSWIQAKPHRR